MFLAPGLWDRWRNGPAGVQKIPRLGVRRGCMPVGWGRACRAAGLKAPQRAQRGGGIGVQSMGGVYVGVLPLSSTVTRITV